MLVDATARATFKMNHLPRGEKQNGKFKNPDNDSRGAWPDSAVHAQVRCKVAEPDPLNLDAVPAQTSDNDLVRWLDRECRQTDIAQPTMLRWLLALVQHLQRDCGLWLTALVRTKNPLAEAVRRELGFRRQTAVVRGFQQALPGRGLLPGTDDTREKAQMGHPWAHSSGGRCLFLLATAPQADPAGRSLAQQVTAKIDGR